MLHPPSVSVDSLSPQMLKAKIGAAVAWPALIKASQPSNVAEVATRAVQSLLLGKEMKDIARTGHD